MENNNMEHIVKNLFLFLPMLKKKVMKWNLYRADLELSPSHIYTLFMLEEVGTITLTELAKNLDISKPNITPLIQKLFDRGYVERINSNEDRRFINIQLTADGRSFIENHKKTVEANLEAKLSKLSKDDLSRLKTSLYNIKDILDKIE